MVKKLRQKVNSKGLIGALARQNLKEETRRKLAKKADAQKEQKLLKSRSVSGGKSKKSKAQVHQVRGLVPFTEDDKVLLVGEGDFLFARSIIAQGMVLPSNLIATSFDSNEEIVRKYPGGVEENIKFLLEAGVDLRYEIDATDLVGSLKLKKNAFKLFRDNKNLDYIVFNFPHTGRGMKDQDRNIRDHQRLVQKYFQSLRTVLRGVNRESKSDFGGYYAHSDKSGKIILLLFEGEPYRSWNIKLLGRGENLRLERSGLFDWTLFPEYHHKRTNGVRDTTKPAPEREARMYIFEETGQKKEEQKKRNDDSDDE